jgi:hypothetical protein
MRGTKLKLVKNQVFGYLEIIEEDGFKLQPSNSKKNLKGIRKYLWKCRCTAPSIKTGIVCNKIVTIAGSDMVSGRVISCGCCRGHFGMGGLGKEYSKRRNGIGNPAFRTLLRRYKGGAKDRSIKWTLTDEEFLGLTSSPCFYTGRLPSSESRSEKSNLGLYLYNGIDRLDSSKGYTKDNCVPCCKQANFAKHTQSFDEFIEMCNMVSDRFRK